MSGKPRVTMALAVAGTVVLALLIAATLVLSPRGIIVTRVGWLAYLAVASMDLLPVAVLGCALLLWSALRAAALRVAVVVGAAMVLGSSVAGRLTSPAINPLNWSFGATLVIVFWAGVVLSAANGVLLVAAIVRRRRTEGMRDVPHR